MFVYYANTGVTVELGELVRSGVNIWDFDYPSYYKDEAKAAFEQKVIDHYYFRQIGQETVGRWLHYFRARIREIMPYYIQMYKSVEMVEAIEDPFQSYDLTETYTEERTASGTVEGESSAGSNTSATNTNNHTENSTVKHSDTPMGTISNLDTHLSDATKNDLTGTDNNTSSAEANTTGTSSETSENTESVTHTLTRKGNIGVQPLGQEVEALRKSFINVDMMIINELNDLFLQVY